MEFKEYTNKANKTLNNHNSDTEAFTNYALGLVGESAEVSEHVKKYAFHGHSLDVMKVIDELGDVLWYINAIATMCGSDLEQVAKHNNEKLERRYGKTFSKAKSINRIE